MPKSPLDIRKLLEDLSYLRKNVTELNKTSIIPDPEVKCGIPIIGGLITFIRRVTRKLVYWLVLPLKRHQTMYNRVLADSLSDAMRILTQLVESNPRALLNMLNGNVNTLNEYEPRIIQLVSDIKYGDAVGNEVISIQKSLEEKGIKIETYSYDIDHRIPASVARLIWEMPHLNENDVILLHYAGSSLVAKEALEQPCRKILRYHNITSPIFYHNYDEQSEELCKMGLDEVSGFADKIDACIPVSDYNARDLSDMGYDCPMFTVPIIIPFDDYLKQPEQSVIDRYVNDGYKNLMFLGRVVPNKKIEDVLLCFNEYRKTYDEKTRLFIVGSFNENSAYYKELLKVIKNEKIEGVTFTGHTPFAHILAYYTIADVFICMSEHEGFCVPLIESMVFEVPIVAYNSTAIPDTLGEGGILLDKKDPITTASAVNNILTNEALRKSILAGQKQQLERLKQETVANELLAAINETMKCVV